MANVQVTPMTLSTVWHAFQGTCKGMRHVIDRTSQNYLIPSSTATLPAAAALAVPSRATQDGAGAGFPRRGLRDL